MKWKLYKESGDSQFSGLLDEFKKAIELWSDNARSYTYEWKSDRRVEVSFGKEWGSLDLGIWIQNWAGLIDDKSDWTPEEVTPFEEMGKTVPFVVAFVK